MKVICRMSRLSTRHVYSTVCKLAWNTFENADSRPEEDYKMHPLISLYYVWMCLFSLDPWYRLMTLFLTRSPQQYEQGKLGFEACSTVPTKEAEWVRRRVCLWAESMDSVTVARGPKRGSLFNCILRLNATHMQDIREWSIKDHLVNKVVGELFNSTYDFIHMPWFPCTYRYGSDVSFTSQVPSSSPLLSY